MPRKSRLDPDSIVDAAMAVFWVRGHEAASMAELVEATGAARHGLYSLFGDKRGLYLAALERYQQVIVNRLFAGVEARDASLDQVRGYFDGLFALAASPQGRWGCMMVGAAAETAPGDETVAGIVAAYRTRLSEGFAAALGRARRAGRLDRKVSPEDLAAELVLMVFGLSAISRSGGDLTPARRALAGLLASSS